MDRLSHSALSGMRTAMASQTITANNLANASTTGFRRDFANISALAATEAGSRDRMFANERGAGVDFTPGTTIKTDRPLDIALQGDSMIAVQSPGGGEGYTRRGDLNVNAGGLLVNGAGHPVIGTNGPITLPAADHVMIAADGRINIRPQGGAIDELVEIGQLKLVTPTDDDRMRRENDLFRTDGDLQADAGARLASGVLESSNVDSAAAMVELIEQARRFEMNVGLLTTARDLDAAGASLLRQE
ncbi:flagellar basal body rod protein FlgF [Pacificimonas sp. WHA3]|uniref:Flagellar basal-body rod protein FlgF n=1 Tax=Pacificimonas pallii TaxID=2827236 RepID=A0ABS6SF32_9SPHN|nr:flagellar basal body rod protein FlgF [Pacificimonas pallii]MBV7257015.1 flagellar basal body rod protein FlgF [Pacificimonas pallii]